VSDGFSGLQSAASGKGLANNAAVGLLGDLKTEIGNLFSGIDLGPLGDALGRVGDKLSGLLKPTQDLATSFGIFFNGTLKPLGEFLGGVLAGAFGIVSDVALKLFNNLGLGRDVMNVITTLAENLGTVINALGNVMEIVAALLRGDWSGAWDHAKNVVADAVTLVT